MACTNPSIPVGNGTDAGKYVNHGLSFSLKPIARYKNLHINMSMTLSILLQPFLLQSLLFQSPLFAFCVREK